MVRPLSVAVALCAASLAVANPASAATACWKNVLTDSYDGRLDRTYPVRCYGVALRHVPADVDAYTSASDDIRRALLAALTPGSASASSDSTRKTATSARRLAASETAVAPVGALAADRAPAKTIRSPSVVLGIAAGVITCTAVARFLVHRRRRPGSTGSVS